MVFPSGYIQEAKGKRAPKVQGARGFGGMLPQKCLFLGPWTGIKVDVKKSRGVEMKRSRGEEQ